MAKTFPRIAYRSGFGVGGPPAAHQLKSVRLAVQIETANSATTMSHRFTSDEGSVGKSKKLTINETPAVAERQAGKLVSNVAVLRSRVLPLDVRACFSYHARLPDQCFDLSER